MTELRRLYLERAEAKRRLYEQYKAGVTEVVDLCSSDSDGDVGGNGAGQGRRGGACEDGMTESNCERLANESD